MRALVLLLAILAACRGERTTTPAVVLEHDAYVWQSAWTPAVSTAVATAPADLGTLRILVLEVSPDGGRTWPSVDISALRRAARPIVAVIRIDGSRPPPDLDLDDVLARVRAWPGITGIEIDHDCATAGLETYATWLDAHRPRALRWSITALPTWASSPALPRIAAAVDELVVQVHAIRAPRLFDPAEARAWLDTFAAAAPGATLRVALPTYRVTVAGQILAAAPDEVAALVHALQTSPVPALRGVVWFRLPVAGDTTTWPTSTLLAAIRGTPPPAVAVELLERAPGQHDIVLANPGTTAAPFPTITLGGDLAAADLVAGYRSDDAAPHRWSPPARDVPPGTRTVVGWATGKAPRVELP